MNLNLRNFPIFSESYCPTGRKYILSAFSGHTSFVLYLPKILNSSVADSKASVIIFLQAAQFLTLKLIPSFR